MTTRSWGETRGPRHEDGSPVITHRLLQKLTPREIMMYSADGLSAFLVHRLWPDVQDSLIDSWSLDDFVAYGLEKAVQHDTDNRGAVLHWVRQELWKRTKKQQRYFLSGGVPTQLEAAPEEIPDGLPAEVIEWLEINLPEDVTQALVLIAEQDWTLDQVCDTLGLDMTMMGRSLKRLRALIKEENRGESNHE